MYRSFSGRTTKEKKDERKNKAKKKAKVQQIEPSLFSLLSSLFSLTNTNKRKFDSSNAGD